MNTRPLLHLLFHAFLISSLMPFALQAATPFELFKAKMSKLTNVAKDDLTFIWNYGKKKIEKKRVTEREMIRANKILLRMGITLGVLIIIIGALIGAAVVYSKSGSGSSGSQDSLSMSNPITTLREMNDLTDYILRGLPRINSVDVERLIVLGNRISSDNVNVNSPSEVKEAIKTLALKINRLNTVYSSIRPKPTSLADLGEGYNADLKDVNPRLNARDIYGKLGLTRQRAISMSREQILDAIANYAGPEDEPEGGTTFKRQVPYIFSTDFAKETYDNWLMGKISGEWLNMEVANKLMDLVLRISIIASSI